MSGTGALGGLHHDGVINDDFFRDHSEKRPKYGDVVTLTLYQKRGRMDFSVNGELLGTVFDNISTSEQLFFAGRVCGHTGAVRLRICDEFSADLIGIEPDPDVDMGDGGW